MGCQTLGELGESVYVARRFRTEEERDRFDLMLKKFGQVLLQFLRSPKIISESLVLSRWLAFTMKPLWKVTVFGDPCLVVSAAGDILFYDIQFSNLKSGKAVYTVQDMQLAIGEFQWLNAFNLVIVEYLREFYLCSLCHKVPQVCSMSMVNCRDNTDQLFHRYFF